MLDNMIIKMTKKGYIVKFAESLDGNHLVISVKCGRHEIEEEISYTAIEKMDDLVCQ